MSISRYDPSGFSGQSYDRNVFEANLSTVNKLQRDYWNAKQVLRKKLGKQEDKHVVASDSELDSKLELFRSIQTTCADLIKTVEKYQKCVCVLSREENAMGQFLKEQGSLDKTAAGKMMTAVGKAQCYTSQQRVNMRHSLGRLLHDVETFRYRAVSDSVLSVDQMEDARTHYRASLRWMQDISANLDPEQFKKLEKFRKVQHEVRLNKEKFDRQKWAVCQKVDLLCASRSNLFSNTLVPYQNDILKFWEKTAHTMAAVLENIKDYQSYEFKLLKGLNPLQIQESTNDEEAKEQEVAAVDNDDQLINLAGDDQSENNNGENICRNQIDSLELNEKADEDSLINFYDGNSTNGDAYHAIRMLDQNNETQPLLDFGDFGNTEKKDSDSNLLMDNLLNVEDTQPSKEDLDLLNNILGEEETSGPKDLEQQWQSVFGEFVEAPKTENNATAPISTSNVTSTQQTQQNSSFLPSQLLDMMSMDSSKGSFGFNQQASMSSGNFGGYQQPGHTGNMMGYQPPSYQSMFGVPGNAPPTSSLPYKPMTSQSKKDVNGSKSDWFNLFAELDPLQNPDSLGRKKNGDKKESGAC